MEGQFIDMQKLHYFRQVAHSRSFRHAARHLGITQPALTRQVQGLEDMLGVILIHRHTSGNKLTEAGHLLAEKADEILSMSSALKTSMLDLRNSAVGTVTIAISMGHTPVLLDPFLSRFMKIYPNVKLRLMEGLTRHVEEWIETGQADVGVICLPTETCQLLQETLIREELVLLNTDEANSGVPITFPELEHIRLILPLTRFGTRRLLEKMALQNGAHLSPAIEADNRQTVRHLVLSTGGSAIDSARLFAEEIQSRKIFMRPILPKPVREIAIATSRSAALSSAARLAALEIRRSARNLLSVQSTPPYD